jgi:hypothetical protein
MSKSHCDCCVVVQMVVVLLVVPMHATLVVLRTLEEGFDYL